MNEKLTAENKKILSVSNEESLKVKNSRLRKKNLKIAGLKNNNPFGKSRWDFLLQEIKKKFGRCHYEKFFLQIFSSL
ncbi:MAG: hypothetical protein IK062_04550 [Selenomonadaceae bacterium]|nr:hypothetical protein [Selenomonadaceae bacterium]